MPAPATAAEIRDVNVRYHDSAAGEYDSKWGIDFGPVGRGQVLGKLTKALGAAPGPYERALEVGAGTGYFTLNLMQEGVIASGVCADISPGMLGALRANAGHLGLEVDTVVADAERLEALEAESFDLVFGHAVLHHIPDLRAAFAQFHRLLRPGGTITFAGEPSRRGDRLAALPKRGALAVAPVWRRLMRAGAANGHTPTLQEDIESMVDVHAFEPSQLGEMARRSGFEDVRIRGEELLASWFGWANRTLEATARPEEIPWLWRQYAYRGYRALQGLDRELLEGRLPAAWFYNLLLRARKPAAAA